MSAKRCAGNEPVSSNILRIIQEKGYKQCAVAKKAGYSKAVFCNIVNDYRVIRPSDILRIADALGVAPDELLQLNNQGAYGIYPMLYYHQRKTAGFYTVLCGLFISAVSYLFQYGLW